MLHAVTRATGRARPIDLGRFFNASDEALAARLDPLYRAALARLPTGERVFRGLPFRLAAPDVPARWLLLREPVTIPLDGAPASHVVVAHFCDAWRDDDGRRPAGTPLGWVVPAGEPLARYRVDLSSGDREERTIRRRIEVNEGILGWGQMAFAAVHHLADRPLDWRGPHVVQARGRYAAAGHAVALVVLPGTWGAAQTGVADFVPSPSDDALIWLHAIELTPGAGEPIALHLEPLAAGRPGSDVVVAAVTLFAGTASPLRLDPRRTLRVEAPGRSPDVAVDLGVVIRRRPAPDRVDETGWLGTEVAGWGEPRTGPAPAAGEEPSTATLVEVTMAPDAVLEVAGSSVAAAELPVTGALRAAGGVTVEALPTPAERVEVTVHDGVDGPPIPARVRFVAPDGRYLPPIGHRDEVNPGLYEDSGADLLLAGSEFAYVDGDFAIELPIGPVFVEVVHGFEHRPLRTRLDVVPGRRELAITLERPVDFRREGWVSADAHVHFLSPSTALLQARAEGVNLVHLLATQWGDHFTGLTDFPAGGLADASRKHLVYLGTENRQNMLGHVGLLGARRPILPMASGGPPEGRIGDPVRELLADWADRNHAAGGLAIAVHFPLPYAEVAADIVTGRIDAVEAQCFAPGLDNPSILEWYRYLECGYRLPITGGTDKMSAEVPVGAVRTYARLAPGTPLTFEAWAGAIRAGRTFATSGPLLELSVEGHEPGDTIRLPASGGRLAVEARARAAQPVITALEVVVNGRVTAQVTAPTATTGLRLAESVAVEGSAWIAARSRSDREIPSAFATSMAAHTSPVYVEVGGRPRFVRAEAEAILVILEGTRTWLETIATVRSAEERRRLVEFIAGSEGALRERLAREGGSP